jgi:hypothetical protein
VILQLTDAISLVSDKPLSSTPLAFSRIRASGEMSEEQILAVVRALCRPAGPSGEGQPAPVSANTAIQLRPDPELHPVDPI